MSTEVEIFDLLSQNFREAAERCAQLAWHPRRGFIYFAMLKNLKAIEGACMQAAQHREDDRWWPIGMMMGHVHKYAGSLLRGSRSRDDRNQAFSFFQQLADHLRGFQYEAEKVRDERVGPSAPAGYERFGNALLPVPLEGPHRDARPVQVKSPLILPGDPRHN